MKQVYASDLLKKIINRVQTKEGQKDSDIRSMYNKYPSYKDSLLPDEAMGLKAPTEQDVDDCL